MGTNTSTPAQVPEETLPIGPEYTIVKSGPNISDYLLELNGKYYKFVNVYADQYMIQETSECK